MLFIVAVVIYFVTGNSLTYCHCRHNSISQGIIKYSEKSYQLQNICEQHVYLSIYCTLNITFLNDKLPSSLICKDSIFLSVRISLCPQVITLQNNTLQSSQVHLLLVYNEWLLSICQNCTQVTCSNVQICSAGQCILIVLQEHMKHGLTHTNTCLSKYVYT